MVFAQRLDLRTGVIPVGAGDIFSEIGDTGLNRSGGHVLEEYHRDLKGAKFAKAIREMSDNCSSVGAYNWMVEALTGEVSWKVKPPPGKDSPLHLKVADFVESCRDDIGSGEGGNTLTWDDVISEILSFTNYGWCFMEEWAKVRRGDQPAGFFKDEHERLRHVSKYNDGLIGWGGFEPRAQESLLCWEFDSSGRAVSMIQQTLSSYGGTRKIPLSKGALFRARSRKNNPEGFSLLRPAWVDWYCYREIRSLEAIIIERDGAGLVVLEVPAEVMAEAPNGPQYLKAVELVQKIRRNEKEGVVICSELSPDGLPTGWKLRLLASGGARQISTDVALKRYETNILMTLLAEFLKLGTDKVGSFALGDTKMDVVAHAIYSLLGKIVDVFNRVLIPRICKRNGFPADLWPVLTHGPITQPDLTHIANYLGQMIGANALTPGPEIETWLRERANLPAKPPVNPDAVTAMGKGFIPADEGEDDQAEDKKAA